MSSVRTRVDPVTAAVIAGALDSIAVEMGHKLARMSFSSIIRESEDFGCVICDSEARQLCESAQSTPLQSGPIPGYIRGINRRFAELGVEWKPGDVVIHNHSYYGASHQPDVAFCVPIFFGGELVGFSATTAHHLDLGALTPGTCGIVDATDAYAEGLQFAAIKVEEEGRRNEWVWQLIRDNVRAAQIVVGDMGAQVAAAKAGAARYLELIDRYGLQTVRDASDDLMDYSDRMLRREIEALPDGVYEAEGHLDGFVDDPDPAHKNLRIAVAVTVEGSEVTVDLTGTSPQIDLPINMPLEGTVDIAVWMTLRSILLDSATHDPVPTNSGLFRAISITAPEGCLANPRFPAPTIARFCGGNVVADTLMRALAPIVPDRVSAGVGNLKVIAYSGLRDGRHWVHMDIHEASYGGRRGKDGLDAVDTLYANTRNNPIEDVESHLPLRVTQYELLEDGGGAGRWRGGLGSVREVEFLDAAGYSLEGDGSVWAPPGLFGGGRGAPGAVWLNRGRPDEVELPSKFPYRRAAAGDRLCLMSPSGGGYGDPLERDRDAVKSDVSEGYVTPESARSLYGLTDS
ncbi:MAG TPA: hydantoinase B/oxoprolinase family protein [Solirubrobacteraceae bacterium]|nr:hydantoinase B/oxoprolinase family protein [Solirubrobacteraceae bacterium]